MKKAIICILSLFCITSTMAQEPAICGDWIGVYHSWDIEDGSKRKIDCDWKRYIRIKYIEGAYSVRMKTRRADESTPFIYWKECQVIESSNKMIKWEINLGSDYDWSSSAQHNGRLIGHADYYKYCTVILSSGTLKYSEHMLTIYYDKHGGEIGRETTAEVDKHTLYKEESDW